MPKPAQVPSTGRLVALIPRRLMAPTRKTKAPKELRDSEYQRVLRQSADWQGLSSTALLWEMGSITRGTEKDRAYGLAGQISAVGEQLGLAYSAAVEVSLWRWVRERPQELDDERDAAREMSMRAMAECQCYFVMGAAQGLANVCVYALALDPAIRAKLIREFGTKRSKPTFSPFSSNKADWVFMNGQTAKRLVAAVTRSPSEIADLVQPVVDFATSKIWSDLASRRGEDYHQWRPQSHGVAGVSKKSPWQTKGKTHSLGMGPSVYMDAQELADDTAEVAKNAMLELARVMEAFMDRWPAASGTLGGPVFK